MKNGEREEEEKEENGHSDSLTYLPPPHNSIPTGGMDPDGFDPAADTVGAGIYGGSVKRDESGEASRRQGMTAVASFIVVVVVVCA